MGRYKVDQTTGELTLLNPSINDIPIYQGVSGSIMSVAGLVPQAQAGDERKVLLGNGTWGTVGGGGVVDDELSTTSENPVQNKIITGAVNTIDAALGDLTDLDTTAKNSIVAAINEVNALAKELQWMNTHNRYYAAIADDDGTLIVDDDDTAVLGDWKYPIV